MVTWRRGLQISLISAPERTCCATERARPLRSVLLLLQGSSTCPVRLGERFACPKGRGLLPPEQLRSQAAILSRVSWRHQERSKDQFDNEYWRFPFFFASKARTREIKSGLVTQAVDTSAHVPWRHELARGPPCGAGAACPMCSSRAPGSPSHRAGEPWSTHIPALNVLASPTQKRHGMPSVNPMPVLFPQTYVDMKTFLVHSLPTTAESPCHLWPSAGQRGYPWPGMLSTLVLLLEDRGCKVRSSTGHWRGQWEAKGNFTEKQETQTLSSRDHNQAWKVLDIELQRDPHRINGEYLDIFTRR